MEPPLTRNARKTQPIMRWEDLKKKVYAGDGSWRDIYVHDTTRADWAQWIDYVNEHYRSE